MAPASEVSMAVGLSFYIWWQGSAPAGRPGVAVRRRPTDGRSRLATV